MSVNLSTPYRCKDCRPEDGRGGPHCHRDCPTWIEDCELHMKMKRKQIADERYETRPQTMGLKHINHRAAKEKQRGRWHSK